VSPASGGFSWRACISRSRSCCRTGWSSTRTGLRGEGDAYREVTTRAGQYAADWTVDGLPPFQRRLFALLPPRLRTRAAIRTVRQLVRATYPGSRVIVRVEKDAASVDLRGSLFCEVREPSPGPLCGFYTAAITRVLHRFDVPAEARVETCRAESRGPGCLMRFVVRPSDAAEAAVS